MRTRDLTRLHNQVLHKIMAIQGRYEREIFVNYKSALDKIRTELDILYQKYSKAGALTYAEMSKFNRLDKLHTQLSDILGPTLSRNGRLVEDLRKVSYEESFYRHAWSINQSAGVDLQWGLLNTKTIKAAVNAPEWRELKNIAIKRWKLQNFTQMDRVITQGLIQGQSYTEMTKGIKKVLGNNAEDAARIARTEAHRATVQGQLASYDEAEDLGVNIKRVWDATLDRATRPDHGAMDGIATEEDGMFHTSFGITEGPGLSGIPEQDINCRCSVRPEIEGYAPRVRRIRDEGVQSYKTYSEWAREKGITVNKYGQKLKL